MVMLTFPQSPLYAGMSRQKMWNENNIIYDSGDMQGNTGWVRPLYLYTMPISSYNEVKQSSLWWFIDQVQQTTKPFLIKDPYDNAVNSVLAVRSGVTNAGTTFLYDTNSYFIRADTTTLGSLTSALSVYVRLGVEYGYDRDSGTLTVNTKVSSDVWGVRSVSYFKKVKFTAQAIENATIWNVFDTSLTFREMP